MTDGFGRPERGSRRVSGGMVLGGIAAVLALVFVVQNTESGTVQFLAWDFTLATWLWALVLFSLGAVTGYFLRSSRRRS